ncbi:MAG: methyltransferase type 12, partial [Leptothrix sp. (in: Bacteria)]|nr:methyltransferase type 12 [Leptothrix sp. (in: b-proteobacteria)]
MSPISAFALRGRPRPRLPWPLPALLVWAAGWLGWALLGAGGLPPAMAFAGALALAALGALACRGRWRRAIAAAGFPLSALALGTAGAMPPWVWLLLLLPVLALYPLRAWRDAPLFPT